MKRLLIIGIFLSLLFSCHRQEVTDNNKNFSSITKMEKVEKEYAILGADDCIYICNNLQLENLYTDKYYKKINSFENFFDKINHQEITPDFTTDMNFTYYNEKVPLNVQIKNIYLKYGKNGLLRKYFQGKESDEYVFNTTDQEIIFNVVFYLSKHGYKYCFDDLSGKHYLKKQLKGKDNSEPITLVGHSHGGNVSIEAINMMTEMDEFKERQINLLTINTPVREDYQLSKEAQQRVNHVNVYDPKDPVQIRGGNDFIVLPDHPSKTKFTGEYGKAGRTFKDAKNIEVDNPQGWIGDYHNSHNRIQDWITKTSEK